jgi:hypothetical protein
MVEGHFPTDLERDLTRIQAELKELKVQEQILRNELTALFPTIDEYGNAARQTGRNALRGFDLITEGLNMTDHRLGDLTQQLNTDLLVSRYKATHKAIPDLPMRPTGVLAPL